MVAWVPLFGSAPAESANPTSKQSEVRSPAEAEGGPAPGGKAERWISVVTHDGREAGILLDVRDLTPDSRACAREYLRRRYMVPEILRIVACRDRFDLVEWTVEIDRGCITFLARQLREHVKRPLPSRLVLVDVEGNRYDVPDLEALDSESRRPLEEQTRGGRECPARPS